MKKLIIIGAGIAGMTSGVYGQMNGFETEIYEMHSIPGGECTGWDRGGYHFDGCIHWLMGSKAGTPLNKVWREVGALDDSIEIINNPFHCSYEENGKTVYLYRDAERLEKHFLEIAPEDEKVIRAICKAIRVFNKMEMPIDKPRDMYSKIDGIKMVLKMIPLMSSFKKYGSMSVREFSQQFKSPLLRKVFQYAIPNEYTSISVLMMLSSMNDGDSGWPMGGSRKFAQRMEKRYLELGGKIYYKAPVAKIKIKDGKAVGIILADGTERHGDYIISAADGYFTLQKMLEGKYMDERLKKLYSDHVTYPVYTSVQVSIGVNCDLSKYPHVKHIKLSQKIDAGSITHEVIGLKHFCYDKTIAPKGKSVVTVFMDADYDWWTKKYKDKEAYKAEKQRIALEVCSALEQEYPETKGKIEITDVATPMTYVRYCNAWKGAWMSWMITPKNNMESMNVMTGKLSGLDNFYMTGQWIMPPGGLPGAVVTGKGTIQRLCKEYGHQFKTTV